MTHNSTGTCNNFLGPSGNFISIALKLHKLHKQTPQTSSYHPQSTIQFADRQPNHQQPMHHHLPTVNLTLSSSDFLYNQIVLSCLSSLCLWMPFCDASKHPKDRNMSMNFDLIINFCLWCGGGSRETLIFNWYLDPYRVLKLMCSCIPTCTKNNHYCERAYSLAQ